jgi:SAM-dependent methyltransferase
LQCGYVRAVETPTDDELRSIYDQAYFSGQEYRDYLADRTVIEATLIRRLARVRARVTPGGRLLELGCAYGFFLALARTDYPDSAGVDIAESPTQFARDTLRLDVRTGDLRSLGPRAKTFDAACLWDTIEHLSNPAEIMAGLADRVRPGGWLFLTTGDIGALVPRLQGRRWRMVHPPSHLHYFTRPAMVRLLARHGFAARRITSAPVDRTIEQIVHGLSLFGGSAAISAIAAALHRRLPIKLARRCIPLDLGDIMLVEAQRRGPPPQE